MTIQNCPCCSNFPYSECCQKLHNSLPAKNALQLMRSRFSAYALQLPLYIIKTTHTDNSQYSQNILQWSQEILDFCQNTTFEKLEIIEFIDGKKSATVTFLAHLIQHDEAFKSLEKSLFKKVNNQWLYVKALEQKSIK